MTRENSPAPQQEEEEEQEDQPQQSSSHAEQEPEPEIIVPVAPRKPVNMKNLAVKVKPRIRA